MEYRVFNPDGTITTIIPVREWIDPITGMKETLPRKLLPLTLLKTYLKKSCRAT
jgi:hypothetical protein